MIRIPNRRSLQWYIYSVLVTVIILAVISFCILSINILKKFYYQQSIQDLEVMAELTGSQILTSEAWIEKKQVRPSKTILLKIPNLRINIYDVTGKELFASHKDIASSANGKTKSEVKTALKNKVGTARRYLSSIADDVLYLAIKIQEQNSELIVRLGLPYSQVSQNIRSIWKNFIIFGFVFTVLALILTWSITKHLLLNINILQKAAERMSRGNFSERIELPKQAELAKLAHAMNKMAHELDDQIKNVINQRNQLDTVLAGMTESVVAFDLEQKIIFMNPAAEKLLKIEEQKAISKTIQEIVRNNQLYEMVEDLISNKKSNSYEFSFGIEPVMTLQARSGLLNDETGKAIGGLLVLNDITELRHLERVRKDFVANVSHELRTPITSIKGFVETLLTSEVTNEERVKFLKIISTHANRLATIIDDLLALSTLEQQDSEGVFTKENIKISDVIDSAINSCITSAKNKNITIQRTCREELSADITPSLLEQALVNYIDNAIKYSEPNSTVRVEARETDNEIILAVHDNGCGISEEHHPRLFERFYRVDKARSRKAGGTGLGLSIVKHIAQSLGGYPSVVSSLGNGSSFLIHLPK